MKKFTLFASLLALVLIFTACKSDEKNVGDDNKAETQANKLELSDEDLFYKYLKDIEKAMDGAHKITYDSHFEDEEIFSELIWYTNDEYAISMADSEDNGVLNCGINGDKQVFLNSVDVTDVLFSSEEIDEECTTSLENDVPKIDDFTSGVKEYSDKTIFTSDDDNVYATLNADEVTEEADFIVTITISKDKKTFEVTYDDLLSYKVEIGKFDLTLPTE